MDKIVPFGVSPKLYYQGKENYQTRCGSILTILTGISLIFAIIFYGRELITKENP